jgi:hypothetical protein
MYHVSLHSFGPFLYIKSDQSDQKSAVKRGTFTNNTNGGSCAFLYHAEHSVQRVLISNTLYKEQPDNTRLYYVNAVNIQALTSTVIHRIQPDLDRIVCI